MPRVGLRGEREAVLVDDRRVAGERLRAERIDQLVERIAERGAAFTRG